MNEIAVIGRKINYSRGSNYSKPATKKSSDTPALKQSINKKAFNNPNKSRINRIEEIRKMIAEDTYPLEEMLDCIARTIIKNHGKI